MAGRRLTAMAGPSALVRLVLGPFGLTTCIVSSHLGLSACIVSSHLGPGVLRSDWQEPRRDPDPTADFTKEQTTSPWVPETQAVTPGTASYQAQRGLAILAAIVAGAVPMIAWYGTFDENWLGPTSPRPTVTPRGAAPPTLPTHRRPLPSREPPPHAQP
jgi:hypothetical protein